MKKIVTSLICLTTVLVGLASCSTTNNESLFDKDPTTFDHYYSDKISFADMHVDINGKTFLEDRIEKVDIKSVTDGDTAVFYTKGMSDSFTNPLKKEHDYVTLRFLGIDTPESTSSIAPWGKKASNYAKSLLENSEACIIDATSIDTSRYTNIYDTFVSGVRLDSNGSRWLGLVWYCPQGYDANDLSNYRSYQLDIIEEGYSFYTGNLGETGIVYTANKNKEPKLYSRHEENYGSMLLGDVFFEADLRMQALKKRYVGSEVDPNYDYSTTPTQMTITDAVKNFDGLTNNCKYIALTGVITRFVGVNFYFEDAQGTPLYVYMGINAKSIGSLFKVGDTINIRGRLSEYGGQKQLTDIVYARDTFVKITDSKDVVALPEPITLDPTKLSVDYLNNYISKLVKIDLQFKGGKKTEANMSKDMSYTVYAKDIISGLTGSYNTMSVRINGTLNPGYSLDEVNGEGAYEGKGYINKTVTVTGIMGIYLEEDLTATTNEPSYQLVLGNRELLADGTYKSDMVVKS